MICCFQAEDGIRDAPLVTGVQTCALPILKYHTGWNREQRRWIFNAANKLGMNAAAHVPVSNGSLGRLNLTTIADGATTTEHGISYDDDLFYDVKQYLVQSHVAVRSEEHTSELQSLMRISYAVFCLKKKKLR